MTAAAGVAVLDTNVWLDLYVFLDPACAALRRCLSMPGAGGLRAVRSDRTDAEIDAVLARPAFAALQERAAAGREAWRLDATRVAEACAAPWSCRDADDQKFLELACAAGASLLLTKDKALLSLDRRSRASGLRILTPSAFARALAGDGQAQGERVVQRVVAP